MGGITGQAGVWVASGVAVRRASVAGLGDKGSSVAGDEEGHLFEDEAMGTRLGASRSVSRPDAPTTVELLNERKQCVRYIAAIDEGLRTLDSISKSLVLNGSTGIEAKYDARAILQALTAVDNPTLSYALGALGVAKILPALDMTSFEAGQKAVQSFTEKEREEEERQRTEAAAAATALATRVAEEAVAAEAAEEAAEAAQKSAKAEAAEAQTAGAAEAAQAAEAAETVEAAKATKAAKYTEKDDSTKATETVERPPSAEGAATTDKREIEEVKKEAEGKSERIREDKERVEVETKVEENVAETPMKAPTSVSNGKEGANGGQKASSENAIAEASDTITKEHEDELEAPTVEQSTKKGNATAEPSERISQLIMDRKGGEENEGEEKEVSDEGRRGRRPEDVVLEKVTDKGESVVGEKVQESGKKEVKKEEEDLEAEERPASVAVAVPVEARRGRGGRGRGGRGRGRGRYAHLMVSRRESVEGKAGVRKKKDSETGGAVVTSTSEKPSTGQSQAPMASPVQIPRRGRPLKRPREEKQVEIEDAEPARSDAVSSKNISIMIRVVSLF